MYTESNKAIYVTLEASLLFWEKLSKSLEEMEYQINEYYWCVMKKIIDNKQCTIIWHFDDLKKLHVDPDVVSSVLSEIDAENGKIEKRPSRREKYINTSG